MIYCSISGGFEKEFSFLWTKDLLGQESWTEHCTPKWCTSMPQTGYISFNFFFLSLKQMDLTFLPFHNSTFIWILEFGQLPGLRFRYSSLWMIKIKRRRRHGKGSIFSWSTGWDDQRAVRCSAEHAFHCSSSIWREEFFFIQGICGLHIKWHPSNGSQHSHSWIMTPCSCASAAAHYGSMHPCSPQPGLE